MPDNTVSGAGGSAGASQLDNLEYVGEGRVKFSNGSTMSVMEALSFLFLERAETYSQLTKDKMQETQDNLNQIKEAREMLQKARDAGINVVDLSDEQLSAAKQIVYEEEWPAMESVVGKDIMDQIRSIVGVE